jgi:hypothetical protein
MAHGTSSEMAATARRVMADNGMDPDFSAEAVAQTVNALVGGMAAKGIAGRGWAAWTVAGFFAVYVLVTTMILPMPGWLQAIAVTAPLIGGLVGNHLVRERQPAAATPQTPADA